VRHRGHQRDRVDRLHVHDGVPGGDLLRLADHAPAVVTQQRQLRVAVERVLRHGVGGPGVVGLGGDGDGGLTVAVGLVGDDVRGVGGHGGSVLLVDAGDDVVGYGGDGQDLGGADEHLTGVGVLGLVAGQRAAHLDDDRVV